MPHSASFFKNLLASSSAICLGLSFRPFRLDRGIDVDARLASSSPERHSALKTKTIWTALPAGALLLLGSGTWLDLAGVITWTGLAWLWLWAYSLSFLIRVGVELQLGVNSDSPSASFSSL